MQARINLDATKASLARCQFALAEAQYKLAEEATRQTPPEAGPLRKKYIPQPKPCSRPHKTRSQASARSRKSARNPPKSWNYG